STCDSCLREERARLQQQAAEQVSVAQANQRDAREAADRRRSPDFAEQVSRVLVTTAPTLPGYRITETLEVVTSERVLRVNIFEDMFVRWITMLGGRGETTQKVFRDGRKLCLHELKAEAVTVGGNAVIATSLDYTDIGRNDSVLLLVASGTAVRVEPLEPSVEDRAS
ncbi:MAG: heavy metal-binding domain-containing protein, partial [Gemmatimonadetes bacterium]|nr:heavy metal-binding domain-containing protein [Gemmatimonadota bacterium]